MNKILWPFCLIFFCFSSLCMDKPDDAAVYDIWVAQHVTVRPTLQVIYESHYFDIGFLELKLVANTSLKIALTQAVAREIDTILEMAKKSFQKRIVGAQANVVGNTFFCSNQGHSGLDTKDMDFQPTLEKLLQCNSDVVTIELADVHHRGASHFLSCEENWDTHTRPSIWAAQVSTLAESMAFKNSLTIYLTISQK